MNRRLVAGLDLGGTNIKGALLDEEGNIIIREQIATFSQQGPESVTFRMAELIRGFQRSSEESGDYIAGVGIGIPGLANKETGEVIFAPNLHWRNIPLTKWLRETVAVPIFLENDANVAALGEQWLGAGQGSLNMIMITIGTGVGGGLILNGRLYSGAGGGAGEIGHTIIDPEGPLCSCGRQGCLETFTSATAMIRMAREAIERGDKTSLAMKDQIEALDIISAAVNGDKTALEIVDYTAHYLGIGIANMISIFNPDTVVVGGGVSGAGDILFNPLRSSVRKWSLEQSYKMVRIVPAKLGNDAGFIGAARLTFQSL